MRPVASSCVAPGHAILDTLLSRCDAAEVSGQLQGLLTAPSTPREELEALLARLVADGVLDRISARAVSLILAGQLDPQDLKQLLPPRRLRATRGGPPVSLAESTEGRPVVGDVTVPGSVRPAGPGDRQEADPAAAFLPSGLATGEMVGRCVIEGLLHAGRNGAVYRGRHVGLGCPVVVKVAAPGPPSDQLRVESVVLAEVTHRNVVRLWDAGTVNGLPYLVTEYLAASCQELLQREGRLAPERVFRLGRDFARGLRAAWRAGFTHGDVKPGNLLVGADDRGKVADFGLARRIGAGGDREVEPVAGTWQYAAPERFAGVLDHRGDIYSLGLTLYQLLTGVPPVRCEGHRECLRAHRELVLEPPHWRLAGVSRQASALLLRMASRDPDRRPADYDELIDALGRLTEPVRDQEPALDDGDAP